MATQARTEVGKILSLDHSNSLVRRNFLSLFGRRSKENPFRSFEGTSTGDGRLMERERFPRAGLVTLLPGGLGIVPAGSTTGVPGAWLKRGWWRE